MSMLPLGALETAGFYVAALALGYLFGSIPFGLLLTRLAGTQDIRSIGSGNIGATNVLRTGRKGLAVMTLLADALKGTAAVLIVAALARWEFALAAGLGAFLGHLFPAWLRFKGGKGVATYIGVLLAVAWPVMLIFLSLWLMTAVLTRYSSVSALVASAVTPLALWWMGLTPEAWLFFAMTVLTWTMHRTNIARLFAGSEGKISFGSARANSAESA